LIYEKGWIHGVEDILLGFEPKDAGSIPAGSVVFIKQALNRRIYVLYTSEVL
jgi:hypothetical protein